MLLQNSHIFNMFGTIYMNFYMSGLYTGMSARENNSKAEEG
jgi:hypothetical protein